MYQTKFILKNPITHQGKRFESVTLREPKLGDLADCELPFKGQLQMNTLLILLIRLSGLPPVVVGEIGVVDAGPIIHAILSMFAELLNNSDAPSLPMPTLNKTHDTKKKRPD